MNKHTFDIFDGQAIVTLATVTFYGMTRSTASREAEAIAKRLSPQDWTISYSEPVSSAMQFITDHVEVR